MPSPDNSTTQRLIFSFFFWWKLLSLLRVDGWLLWHRAIAFPRIESLKEGLMNCWIFLLFSTQQVLWFQPSKFSSIECSCWSTVRATVSKTLSKSSQSILERCSLWDLDSPSHCPSLSSSLRFLSRCLSTHILMQSSFTVSRKCKTSLISPVLFVFSTFSQRSS